MNAADTARLRAAIADKDNELRSLRGRLADLHAKHPEESCYAVGNWDRLRGKIATLVAMLERYGRHDAACALGRSDLRPVQCSCGLEQARTAEVTVSAAVVGVLTERRRQVESEGYRSEDDDRYGAGQLSAAAGCYALFADKFPNRGQPPPDWPWPAQTWKPRTYRRDMERAAAMLIADIERVDRNLKGVSR